MFWQDKHREHLWGVASIPYCQDGILSHQLGELGRSQCVTQQNGHGRNNLIPDYRVMIVPLVRDKQPAPTTPKWLSAPTVNLSRTSGLHGEILPGDSHQLDHFCSNVRTKIVFATTQNHLGYPQAWGRRPGLVPITTARSTSHAQTPCFSVISYKSGVNSSLQNTLSPPPPAESRSAASSRPIESNIQQDQC